MTKLQIIRIDGPRLYYGREEWEYLHFGRAIDRIEISSDRVIVKAGGRMFSVYATSHKDLPWVFEEVKQK